MDYGKVYNKIPRKVLARQWTPWAGLPHVRDIEIEIPEPAPSEKFKPEDILRDSEMSNFYSNPQKTIKVCIKGQVRLQSGAIINVSARDFVLYDFDSKIPISVISEDSFLENYSEKFSLCEKCEIKAIVLTSPKNLADQYINILKSGEKITLDDGTVISSIEELNNWFEKKNAVEKKDGLQV